MALPSVAYTYKLNINRVDEGVYTDVTVTAARHPSETLEHLQLRVLALCLFWAEGVEFGPALADAEGADVWGRDLTGQVTLWVECGAADPEKTQRMVNAHPRARVVVLTCVPRREEEFLTLARKAGVRKLDKVELWRVPEELMAELGAQESRRNTWSVTVSEGHLYLETDGRTLDAELVHRKASEAMTT
ncbi:MAG: YaeQ family protein [Myxococcota bacterium]